MKKPRAGCRIYKDKEIPINAKIEVSPNGNEFYLTGIEQNSNQKFTATIKLIESGELHKISFEQYEKIKQQNEPG